MSNTKKIIQAAAGSAGGAGLNIEEAFSTYLYEGTGSAQTITNDIDLAGEGGFVWVKCRDASFGHYIFYDNGSQLIRFEVNETYAEASVSSSIISSLNSDGFTIGGHNSVGGSSLNYASYSFREAPKFMDMVFYSGQSSNSMQVSHSLGHTVGAIICKKRNTSGGWAVYHRSLGTGNYITLNDNFGSTADSNFFPAVTSTYFQPGSDSDVGSGNDYVAFLFAHHDGDGNFGPDGDQDAIKCDSYTGNGSTSGPEINLGFEPQWLLIKRADGTDSWQLLDNMRGIFTDGNDAVYNPNNFNTESSGNPLIDLTSTGFKVRSVSGAVNNSGEKYIYIAIRKAPMAVPESATDVYYNTTDSTNSNTTYTTGFPVDFMLQSYTGITSSLNHTASSRLQGFNHLDTALYTSSLAAAANIEVAEGWDSNTSFEIANEYYSSNETMHHALRRAPLFFDVVAYTGDDINDRQLNHNLGIEPEMAWFKSTSHGYSWVVFHKDVGLGQYANGLSLNNNDPAGNFNTPVHSVDPAYVTISNGPYNNWGNIKYVGYFFASLDGISKVGSYTGDGTAYRVIDCGFSSTARFVMIKRTDDYGDWYVWNSETGIVSGNDPHQALNSDGAEVTSDDSIEPSSAGFAINQDSATNINVSSATYIFYAIA